MFFAHIDCFDYFSSSIRYSERYMSRWNTWGCGLYINYLVIEENVGLIYIQYSRFVYTTEKKRLVNLYSPFAKACDHTFMGRGTSCRHNRNLNPWLVI